MDIRRFPLRELTLLNPRGVFGSYDRFGIECLMSSAAGPYVLIPTRIAQRSTDLGEIET
jgi:hypothetical protein